MHRADDVCIPQKTAEKPEKTLQFRAEYDIFLFCEMLMKEKGLTL